MSKLEPLPSGLPADFRVADAVALGVSRRRLRALSLERPHHGLRVRTSVRSVMDAAQQFGVLIGDRNVAFSHQTAAYLLGMPLPQTWSPNDLLHVMTPNGGGQVRRDGVKSRRGLEARTTCRVGGLLVTDGPSTWCDLATTLEFDDLVAAGDWLLRPRSTLTVDDLRRAVRPQVAGRAKLNGALRWIRPGSASPRETQTRLMLVRDGLPEPQLNATLSTPRGWVAVVDFYWDEWKLALDYDGRYHRERAEQLEYDIDRARQIRGEGFRYEQVTSKHLAGKYPQVLTIVREALLEAGWTPDDPRGR